MNVHPPVRSRPHCGLTVTPGSARRTSERGTTWESDVRSPLALEWVAGAKGEVKLSGVGVAVDEWLSCPREHHDYSD
jgi:hypothetical protein